MRTPRAGAGSRRRPEPADPLAFIDPYAVHDGLKDRASGTADLLQLMHAIYINGKLTNEQWDRYCNVYVRAYGPDALAESGSLDLHLQLVGTVS